MTVSMHVRDVPDDVHEELSRRAALHGMSLRQYTLRVLGEHCAVAPVDEWMDRIARRRARWLAEGREVKVDAAAAVRDGRRDDDEVRARRA